MRIFNGQNKTVYFSIWCRLLGQYCLSKLYISVNTIYRLDQSYSYKCVNVWWMELCIQKHYNCYNLNRFFIIPVITIFHLIFERFCLQWPWNVCTHQIPWSTHPPTCLPTNLHKPFPPISTCCIALLHIDFTVWI